MIEGNPVVQFQTLTFKVDQLLTWGAWFTVFAQSFGHPCVRMTGHLMCVVVLQTDSSAAPNHWAQLMDDYV